MTSGILLVDKPGGMTSHDVVARTRRLAGTRKVGHAGTLDPMATGLLILGVNSATRLLTYVVGLEKEYTATIVLGAATTTDDAEGEITRTAPAGAIAAVTAEAIASGIAALTGEISQVPSSVSAIKVNGERAYALVRAGETVELKSRPVTIAEFELRARRDIDDTRIELDVRVRCSTGTYIRALARDLGEDLGVGGHLSALRRTRIGPFRVEDAPSLEDLDPARQLIGSAAAASELFPVARLEAQRAIDLGHGKKISAEGMPESRGPIAALAPDGALIGLISSNGRSARTIVNFPPDAAPAAPGPVAAGAAAEATATDTAGPDAAEEARA